jgi:hypothetical protein
MSKTDESAVPQPGETAPQQRKPVVVRAWRTMSAIARDPAGAASLFALLFGIIASVVPTPGVWGAGVNSVGYALVGAAAFSFIYQFWANAALVRVINRTIRQAQRRMYREIQEQWSSAISEATTSLDGYMSHLTSLHRRHWPLEVYPEGNSPNPVFNQRLESDLGNASRYDFRGQSGKHLASRLLKARCPRLKTVRIVIEDATIPDVANARIDEKRWGEPERFEGASDDEIRAIIRGDLIDSLIGLYIARVRFDRIELAYASRPTNVRVEITDRIVYVSPYVLNRPSGNRYPEVYRYDPESIPAQVAVLEYDREFSLLSGNKMILSPGTSKENLLQHLVAKELVMSSEDFDLRYRQAEQTLRALGRALGEVPDDYS